MMKTKAFRYLWAGQALANGGDVFFIVALIAAIFEKTQSPFFVSIVPVVVTFSRFVSSVMAPLVLDRFHLKNLLFYSQLVKTILLGIMSLLLLADAGSMFLLFVLAGCVAFLDGVALPARNAFVPSIVRREDLMGANGFLSTIDQGVQFGSWALGGVIVAIAGDEWTMALTALLFLASSVMMYSLPVNGDNIPLNQNKDMKLAVKLAEGWTDVLRNSTLKNIFLVYAIEAAASVVWIAAILYVYVQEQLLRGEEWWGFINSAFFIGLIAAGMLLLRVHRLFSGHMYKWLFIAIVSGSLATFCFGWNSGALLALIFSVIFGFFDGIKVILLQTIVQQSVNPERLGKVFAAQGAMTTLIFGVFSLVAGYVSEEIGVQAVFTASAILLILAVLPVRKLQVKYSEQ
ncbi:MFS transporter [Bacillus sp. AK031]